jgi:alkaline phosphatase
MKIFLITDIHHGANTNYKHLKGEEYINLFGEEFKEASLKLLSEMNQCDLVVNLGDLIHDEEREKDFFVYSEGVSFFDTTARIEHVVGNHDLRNLTMSDLSRVLKRDKEYFSFDCNGYHHVVLGGTRKEPRGPHYIEEEQLKWLEDDLKATEQKTLVYCHFPLDNQDLSENYYFKGRPDGGSIANRGFVRPILEKSGKVLAVFNGHTHFFHQEGIKNIIYTTVPSFSENNGEGRPNHKFAVVEVEGDTITSNIISL